MTKLPRNLPPTALMGVVILIAVTALALTSYAIRRSQDQIHFLCRVSGSVGHVLQQSVDNFNASVKAGRYQQLIQQGVLTQKDFDQAKATVADYKSTIAELNSSDSPCN